MMSIRRSISFAAILGVAVGVAAAVPHAQSSSKPAAGPTIKQFLKPGFPYELVSAKKADRIAWLSYEEGKRNVFTAAAPTFAVTRVTSFLKDDGIDLTELSISDDGQTFVFVRGTAPNNVGWNANPTSNPDGAERAEAEARFAAGDAAAPARLAAELLARAAPAITTHFSGPHPPAR